MVCPMVGNNGLRGRASDLQALVYYLQYPSNGVALCWGLDLDEGTGSAAINDRVSLTGLRVDVLHNISSMGVAPLA
jgi:hypothetical protein